MQLEWYPMTDYSDIVSSVQKSGAKRIIYLPRAVRQMSRPDRMILVAEVRNGVERGELVEDYSEDVRGQSCLLESPNTFLSLFSVLGRCVLIA